MSNPGGRVPRAIIPPESILISHEDRIKILERQDVATSPVAGGRLLSGVGTPLSILGDDGDWYIDTLSSSLYGPKATVWPASPFPLGGGAVLQSVGGGNYVPNPSFEDGLTGYSAVGGTMTLSSVVGIFGNGRAAVVTRLAQMARSAFFRRAAR